MNQVAAALGEGLCPYGHPLDYGGGRWGTCYRCDLSWSLGVGCYSYHAVGDIQNLVMVRDGMKQDIVGVYWNEYPTT
jgi:hypothetical protein